MYIMKAVFHPPHNVKMLIPPGEHYDNHDDYLHVAQEKESLVIGLKREVVAMRKNGEQFPAELTITAVKESSERVKSAIVNCGYKYPTTQSAPM